MWLLSLMAHKVMECLHAFQDFAFFLSFFFAPLPLFLLCSCKVFRIGSPGELAFITPVPLQSCIFEIIDSNIPLGLQGMEEVSGRWAAQ